MVFRYIFLFGPETQSMPLAFDFNADAIGNPISEDQPCGVNLQIDDDGRKLRSQLRDLREEARRLERRADEGDESEGGWSAARSIWTDLRDRCLDTLENRTKDLDVAAMCVESLARTDGFAGLAAGFQLVGILLEVFWAGLYPSPDPEDGPADEETIIIERTLPLQRLSGFEAEGLLVPAILHIPLTTGRSDQAYGLCHWRSSRELLGEESEEKIQLAVDRGAVSPTQFDQSVAETPLEQTKQVYSDLKEALDYWEELTKFIADVSDGKAVVPAGEVRELLQECEAAIQTFAPAAIPAVPSETGDMVEQQGDPAEGVENGQSGGLYPVSREDAFQRLERIAEYFERHDPHSLVAAQIRNIVRLGRLPRGDYYKQLLRDETALGLLFRATGMDDQLPENTDSY
ncbi:MAG: type VI secretion system protein TssA [Gammaproteobacteria bacterium]|nr:type VI secretion system protein TssA [Gammaproteobacteria bacterium]